MGESSFNRTFHHLARIGLALVFVAAGAVKLADISRFADGIGDFGVVYDPLVMLTAWTIALAEVLTGLALATNLRGGLSGAVALLVVFVGVLSYGIWLGLDIDCGCFGPDYRVSLKTQLLIDLGLLLWCGIVHWSQKQCGVRTIDLFTLRPKASDRRKSK